MAGKRSSWLLGCGIGCGVIVLIAVVVIAAGAFFVRDAMHGLGQAVDSGEALDQRLGKTSSYTPSVDGSIPAARMEAFLVVRESLEPQRKEIDRTFTEVIPSAQEARELEAKPFFEKITAVFGIVRSAAGLGPAMGNLLHARNQALLDAGMGMGEYTYIYVLAYHSWLGHSPQDGPGEDKIRVRPEGEPISLRGEGLPSRIRDELLAILRNQLASFDGEPPERQAARGPLAAEIAAMESDPDRLPWQDGLPAATAASLAPYRDRLEAAYSPVTNAFELSRARRRGSWSIEAD